MSIWIKRLGLLALLCLTPMGSGLAQQPDPDALKYLREALAHDRTGFLDPYLEQIWLFDMDQRLTRWVKEPKQRAFLLKTLMRESMRAELDPQLVLAVIEVESAFRTAAVSSAKAQGLMQVMPFWKNEIGRPDDDLQDVATNLRYGCTILRHYLNLEDNNHRRALARYNGSIGKNWYANLVLRAWQRHWVFNND